MALGLRSVLVAAAAAGCVAFAVGEGACVVPPAELQSAPPQRPIILRGSASPSPDQPFRSWPPGMEFVVPVELADVNETWVSVVFVDYDGIHASSPALLPPPPSVPLALDAGVFPLHFVLDPSAFDLTICHTIDLLVGHAFGIGQTSNVPVYHSFDSVGYDTVSWTYQPQALSSCNDFSFDGGTGATADAPSDSLPVTPGGDP